MKKIFSLLMVVAMLLAMSTTAFAAGTGSITVENAVVGETYTIYRLLELESYNPTTGAYAYKANAAWESWLRTQTQYVTFDTQGYVTWVKNADAAAFAKAVKAYAAANSLPHNGSTDAATTTVTFAGLELGYYLMDSSLGTLCSLNTTNPNATIREKNEEPIIKKEVQEDSTTLFGDTNDANIGQTVNFKTTVTAKPGAEGYVVHDILSAGLTLDKTSITVVGLTAGTDYTVAFDQTCKDQSGATAICTFEITFTQDYLDRLTVDTEIIITYSAVVNENAVIAGAGNPNDTVLKYGTDDWTAWDRTVTCTWDMGVLKYGNGNESNVLADAKFVLLNKDKTQVAIFANGKMTGWAAIPTGDDPWPAGSELTTGADGKIYVAGLDADNYFLRETQAPAGYNKLSQDVAASVDRGTVENNVLISYQTKVVKVNNQSGTIFPETGSTGTMMFISIGSLMAIVAVVFIITRKKMSIYEE